MLPVAVGLAVVVAWFGAQNLAAPWINRALLHAPGADKLFHAFQFLVVFLVVHLLVGRVFVTASAGARLRIAVAAALALAVADEGQQALFTKRNVELWDVVANLAGIAAGVSVAARWWRRGARRALGVGAAVVMLAVAANTHLTLRDFNRGLLLESRQEFPAAREAFLRALASGYESAELYNSLGWVEIESGVGSPEKAVEYAGKALAMRPGDADTLDTYGWALHHAGRSEEALGYLSQAYEKKPGIFCIHYHLGVTLLGLGRQDAAVDHLRRQIEEHPRALEAERARVLLAQTETSAR